MARYIDADKVIEELQVDFDKQGEKADDMAMRGEYDLSVKYNHGQFCYLNAIERVKGSPTADVAPKSEVAREIFEEIDKYMAVNGAGLAIITVSKFTELKKKYGVGGQSGTPVPTGETEEVSLSDG